MRVVDRGHGNRLMAGRVPASSTFARLALMPFWNALMAGLTFGVFVQILSALRRLRTELE
jgi:hypothetical protein